MPCFWPETCDWATLHMESRTRNPESGIWISCFRVAPGDQCSVQILIHVCIATDWDVAWSFLWTHWKHSQQTVVWKTSKKFYFSLPSRFWSVFAMMFLACVSCQGIMGLEVGWKLETRLHVCGGEAAVMALYFCFVRGTWRDEYSKWNETVLPFKMIAGSFYNL